MESYPVLIFIAGVVLVVAGAELVMRAASRLAVLLKISPLVIGLTVVSIGTSTPELAIGIAAATEGKGALAVGNIAGTNIFNILFILGLSALIRPLPLRLLSIKFDVPVMIAAALALIAMSWDGILSRMDGALLFLASIVYTVVLIRLTRAESRSVKLEFSREYGGPARRRGFRGLPEAGLLIAGLAICVGGAELLVDGAVDIARMLGVSEAIIGLTIVAVGTSAPEMATTAIATFKDERDIAVGNLIGSSIYNILVILGLTCIASPGGVDVSREILHYDLPLGAAVALVCWPVFKSDNRVSRLEGGLFVAAYLAYMVSLIIRA